MPPVVRTGDATGEAFVHSYDAAGRLFCRSDLRVTWQGGAEADRPLVARRAFVWDGQRLAAEAGLNHHGDVLWRQQYLAGPRGLDDAPQVRVERDLLTDDPTTGTYALARDEMGTLLGVLEERPGQAPALLARCLYAPYG